MLTAIGRVYQLNISIVLLAPDAITTEVSLLDLLLGWVVSRGSAEMSDERSSWSIQAATP